MADTEMKIVATEVYVHIVPEPIEYRLVEAAPERWWKAATYYVDGGYGRMGPMSKEAALRALWVIRKPSVALG